MSNEITPADRDRIAAAIAAAEQTTSAEIVCLVMRAAGDYWTTPALWAALGAFAWPWPLILWSNFSASTIYASQLILFAALALALSIPTGRRLSLTPPWIRRRRARQAAREHFFTQGLHRTVNRSGVLLFVAIAERYAEILTDDGVAQKIAESEWRRIVENLVAAAAAGKIADGLIAAVGQSARILAGHAPPRANERNELPDKVIVI